MNSYLLGRYGSIVLPELAGKIYDDYYLDIEKLVSNIARYVEHLPDTSSEVMAYKTLMNKAENDVREIIKFRKDIIIPYVRELHDKASTGHNCGQCSGKCDVQHKMKTIEFAASQEQMRVTAIIIKTSLPVHDIGTSQGGIKILCNEVNIWYSMIHDVLYLEEYVLMPRIIEAQKKINAHS